MPVTKEQILQRLRTVQHPQLHRDLVTLGRIANVAVCEGYVKVTVELGPDEQRDRTALDVDITAAVGELGEAVGEVRVEFAPRGASGSPSAKPQAGADAPQKPTNPLPGVKHIVAVGAGKGGVGKSTVSVNLAVGLARRGLKVGCLDGDIYGPSLPTLLGLDDMEPRTQGRDTILPFERHGIKAMTLGRLVEADKPLIWRGPMAHSAFRQLATQTLWGELDYLIIDLPPGTGDVPLTMTQLLPLTGAVVVCTPQKVAQDDARRAVRMFESLHVPLLGVVENMSYFIGDDGREYDIFGRGGAQVMAHAMDVAFLGAVPINMGLRRRSDAGLPQGNFTDDAQLATQLNAVIDAFLARVDQVAGELDLPELSIRG